MAHRFDGLGCFIIVGFAEDYLETLIYRVYRHNSEEEFSLTSEMVIWFYNTHINCDLSNSGKRPKAISALFSPIFRDALRPEGTSMKPRVWCRMPFRFIFRVCSKTGDQKLNRRLKCFFLAGAASPECTFGDVTPLGASRTDPLQIQYPRLHKHHSRRAYQKHPDHPKRRRKIPRMVIDHPRQNRRHRGRYVC